MRDPETGTWSIDHDPEATWAIAKIARARQQHAAVLAARRDAVARATTWAKQATAPHDRDDSFFTNMVVDWFARRIPTRLLDEIDTDDGRARWDKYPGKTLSLPTGKVWARVTSGAYQVHDSDAYVGFLLDHVPAAVRDDLNAALDAVASMMSMMSITLDLTPTAPPASHGAYRHDPDGTVSYVDRETGEVVSPVPGLRWIPTHVSFGVTPDWTAGEHPAWDPPPAGSDLPETAPIDVPDTPGDRS